MIPIIVQVDADSPIQAVGPASSGPTLDTHTLSLARCRAGSGRHRSARCAADATGRWWVVSEQPNVPTFDAWFLEFISTGAVRVVDDYPQACLDLDDAELLALGSLEPRRDV